jgi:hypothetical protein
MNEILHANIFFVIASIATVCFAIFVCVILYHVIKIMQSVRSILTRIEEGSEMIAEDLTQLRATILEGGIVSRLMSLFFGKKGGATPKQKRIITKRSHTKSYDNQESNEEDDDL